MLFSSWAAVCDDSSALKIRQVITLVETGPYWYQPDLFSHLPLNPRRSQRRRNRDK